MRRARAEAHALPVRLAFVAAALWCFYPATGVMLLPYTEALAAVLIAAALLMLMRGRYLTVALIALLLGFTRGVAAPLGLAVLAHLWLRWRDDREAGVAPFAHDRLRIVTMVLATGLSGIAWPLTVGWLSGLPDAFFRVQAAWGQRPDEGPFVLWYSWAWDQHEDPVLDQAGMRRAHPGPLTQRMRQDLRPSGHVVLCGPKVEAVD